MIGFESPYPVAVSQVSPDEWELTHELIYHAREQVFQVPVGQRTDFASIPLVLTWLVPTSTGIAAAVLHDHLWRVDAPAGRISYRDADGVLRQALGSLCVPTLRRWLMWAAVRWGSLLRSGGWCDWWRDAPAVVSITVAALPIVAIPTLVAPPFLGFYRIVEALVPSPQCDLGTKPTTGQITS